MAGFWKLIGIEQDTNLVLWKYESMDMRYTGMQTVGASFPSYAVTKNITMGAPCTDTLYRTPKEALEAFEQKEKDEAYDGGL